MKRIYTWAANPAERNWTIGDLLAGKGKRKWVQTTANTAEEPPLPKPPLPKQAGIRQVVSDRRDRSGSLSVAR